MTRSIFLTFAVLVAGAMVSTVAKSAGMDTVTIQTTTGAQSWSVELASDDESRSKGLMFRNAMPAQTGMLFRFETIAMCRCG